MGFLGNRLSRFLFVFGVLCLGIGAVLLADNRFALNNGGHRRIITRQNDPLIYWRIEAGILFVGLLLVGTSIYFGRKFSGTDPESLARKHSFAMRATATTLALFGAWTLIGTVWIACFGRISKWPLTIYEDVLSIFWICIAIGIWRKRLLAWRLGFAGIALGAVNFFVGVCFHLPPVDEVQKTIIIVSCLAGGTAVAVYWWRVWWRQRQWFDCDSQR